MRRAIQGSDESLAALARRLGVNVKTVAKWRDRSGVGDRPNRPRDGRWTRLSLLEEQTIVYYRWCSFLPLDDLLFAIQAHHPDVTRATLHRCLKRYGLNRLPPPTSTSAGGLGVFTVNLAPVRIAEGLLTTWSAVDLTSRFSHAELRQDISPQRMAECLQRLRRATPYPIHTVVTPHSPEFCDLDGSWPEGGHPFEAACREAGLAHRSVPESYAWPKARLDDIRHILEASGENRPNLATDAEIRANLGRFLTRINFYQRLKTLGGVTPFQYAARATGFDWRAYLQDCPFELEDRRRLPAP